MRKAMIDRWADTAAFRALLFASAVAVLPVLGVGLAVSVVGGAVLASVPSNVDLEQLVFAALVLGGVLGLVGYGWAHLIARSRARRSITAPLLLLAVGASTALGVAGGVAFELVSGWAEWGADFGLVLGGAFVAANLVWVISGVAWMQRLARGYAEREGRPFDGLPVLLLFVALALAAAAALLTAAL
jgi:hypothetical protein